MSDEKTVMLTKEELEQIRKGSQEESEASAEESKDEEQKNKNND